MNEWRQLPPKRQTVRPAPHRHDFRFAQQLEDLQAKVANKDYAALINYPHVAQYVEWMRERWEIFEFVDWVGCYGSGWWLRN